MSKIFLCAVVLALFVSGSFAPSGQELAISDENLMANASYNPLEVIANFTLGKEPFCIAVNDETNRVYVGVEGGVTVINGETDQVIAEIPLGADVKVLAVTPQTNRIYAGIWNNITVINGATNLIVRTRPGGLARPYEMAFNPVTNRFYEGWRGPYMGDYDRVDVYNLENLQFITSVNLGISPYMENVGLAVNPKINRVYATWTGNFSLFMIDGNTHEIKKIVRPSSFSETIMVNSYTNYVYVGKAVLNGETLEQVTLNYTGDLRAIDAIHNLLYTTEYEWVTVYDDATKNYRTTRKTSLCRLDGSTHGVIDRLELNWTFLDYFDNIAVNPKTSKIYITNYEGKQVYVVSAGALPQPTPSPTPSPSPAPSPSPSPSPTSSPTPSPTPTPTPAPTPSPSPTSTPGPSPIPSPSPSPSPTPTLTPSPSPSPLPSPTPVPSPSPSPVPISYMGIAVITIIAVAFIALVLLVRRRKKEITV